MKKELKQTEVRTSQEEAKIFRLQKNTLVSLKEPTIRLVKQLKEEGFDVADTAKLNQAYFEMTHSEDKMKRLVAIIFNKPVSEDIIADISISEVKRGLYAFLAESGFVIL